MASEFALDAILLQALQNPKDRAFILGSEKTCESLFHPSLQIRKAQFPPMNSYFRMLMHRIARYYGLIHLADSKTGVVTLTVSGESRLPLVRLAELVEREDLFTSGLKSSNNGSSSKNEQSESKPEVQKTGEAEEAASRVHYSESTSDVAIPRHIIQIRFDKGKTDETTIRSLAAARLNAELRVDSKNSLLIFQSRAAADKALQSNPLKGQAEVTLEKWSPVFFPTSMF